MVAGNGFSQKVLREMIAARLGEARVPRRFKVIPGPRFDLQIKAKTSEDYF